MEVTARSLGDGGCGEGSTGSWGELPETLTQLKGKSREHTQDPGIGQDFLSGQRLLGKRDQQGQTDSHEI